MAGLYIHFPFCKQACHYCNFHFSTQIAKADSFHLLLLKELEMRYHFMDHSPLESIYFGGGSPSLLSVSAIASIISRAKELLKGTDSIEITVELNPDDVSPSYLRGLVEAGVNRVSLGIQSFEEKELKLMNRIHNHKQARDALDICTSVFDNVSVDLIYGIPGSQMEGWEKNLKIVSEASVSHLAAYALTVEPKTVLAKQVAEEEVLLLSEEAVADQYEYLLNFSEIEGYVNYEFSNFGKPNFFSINNSNYWRRKPYLGLGPGAHSYDGSLERNWNLSSNVKYSKAIKSSALANNSETLTTKDLFNEVIMTGLRTQWGVNRNKILKKFGEHYVIHLETQALKHLRNNNLFWDGDVLLVSRKAKFLTDGIVSDLFILHLGA